MAKKRKSHRNKKHRSFLLETIIAIVLICVLVGAYIYRTNPQFKEKADSASSHISEKIESTVAEIEGKIGDINLTGEKNPPEPKAIPPQPAQEQKPNKKQVVALPAGLEIPLCAARHHETDHEIRTFEHYALCYRESYEQAEWSAYCLTEEELAKNANRSNDFRPDPQISTGSASLSDYKKSGYDRGHLSPAADFAFDEKAMSETFYMSNMSPQAGSFNRGIWKDLEAQVRVWAKIFGRVYVVSGPILEKTADEYKSIGENRVTVPEFYYKVILAPLYKDESDRKTPEDAEGAVAIGFIFPNEKCAGSLFDYAVSIDEVERRTQLDFFSLLDDEIENRIEQELSISEFSSGR